MGTPQRPLTTPTPFSPHHHLLCQLCQLCPPALPTHHPPPTPPGHPPAAQADLEAAQREAAERAVERDTQHAEHAKERQRAERLQEQLEVRRCTAEVRLGRACRHLCLWLGGVCWWDCGLRLADSCMRLLHRNTATPCWSDGGLR